MINPFTEAYTTDKTDETLIADAIKGNRHSLESLIRRHQDWIYNIALRMVFNPDEAADVTQEALIKIITKLSTFEGRSSFRTWAYRIVANHVLNIKKSIGEQRHESSFKDYWRNIDATPDFDLPGDDASSVEMSIIVEEVKISCMFGMLLCLNREQRLIYILGSIIGVSDTVGSEIMEISKDNFRQKLSRARKELHNFMNDKCGLVHPDNPCHCDKKTKALLDSGYVNPQNLKFNRNYYNKVRQTAGIKLDVLHNFLDDKCHELFASHPFQQAPDFVENLRQILNKKEFKEIFNFN
jgi:RNA polymerase sigma factor (sigma-70 family)